MTKLIFPAEGVARVVRHALGSKKWGRGYGQTGQPKPCIIFVKDEGIYLMSNGEPADIVKEPQRFVVYAEGYDPTKEDRMVVYDRAREAVGGDDFGDYIEIDEVIRAIVAKRLPLSIMVDGDKLILAAAGPPVVSLR